jgi:hypothetical protein
VAARVRDEAAARGAALAAVAAPMQSDLAAAAVSSLVLPASADVSRTPFTAVLTGPRDWLRDCRLMACGLQALLQKEVRRLAELAEQLARLDDGERKVKRIAPPPAALPVDASRRTRIGQRAVKLICGGATPVAWRSLPCWHHARRRRRRRGRGWRRRRR